MDGLVDGGQGWVVPEAAWQVVKTDHSDVFGNSQSGFPDGPDSAESRHIAGREKAVELSLGEQRFSLQIAAIFCEIAVADAFLRKVQVVCFQSLSETGQAVLPAEPVDGAGDGRQLFPANAHQVLRGQPCAGDVIRVHTAHLCIAVAANLNDGRLLVNQALDQGIVNHIGGYNDSIDQTVVEDVIARSFFIVGIDQPEHQSVIVGVAGGRNPMGQDAEERIGDKAAVKGGEDQTEYVGPPADQAARHRTGLVSQLINNRLDFGPGA